MTNKLDIAIAELTKLPADEQDIAAQAILDFVGDGGRPELSDAQADEVRRRMADPEPRFLTLAEARARLVRQ